MHKLNNKNYVAEYLDEHEKAVLDAMRMGGEIYIGIFDSSYENAMANADATPFLDQKRFSDLTDNVVFKISDRERKVEINHFIEKSH